jgi:hypothetical protein
LVIVRGKIEIPALMAGAMLTVLVACGGTGTPSQPTSTPDAQGRVATSTVEAERAASAVALSATTQANQSARATETERPRPPCLVDTETVEAMRQIAEQFQDTGLELAQSEGTAGMNLYETGLAYGVLADCRDVGGTPAAGTATPVGCIGDAESIQQLRDVGIKGLFIALAGAFPGSDDEETAEAFFALNEGLLERAQELEIACGLASAATPVASPVGG